MLPSPPVTGEKGEILAHFTPGVGLGRLPVLDFSPRLMRPPSGLVVILLGRAFGGIIERVGNQDCPVDSGPYVFNGHGG